MLVDRRQAEQIISAISRRLALAQGEAIDPVVREGLGEVAAATGADGAALLRTGAGGAVEFLHTWFEPARGPLPLRADHNVAPYAWVRERLRSRGPQVISMEEVVRRSGRPAPTGALRHVGLIGTFAGYQVVGVILLYYRGEFAPDASDLAPFEMLGDVLLGAVARRDAEIALRDSEDRYRTIVESSSDGIWTFGPDWRVTFANSRMASMLGLPLDQIVGRPLREFVPPDDRALLDERMSRRERGVNESFDGCLERSDGAIVQVRISTTAHLDADGRFLGALAMVQDVTEERRLQAELNAARRLETVGRLAGGVAHDINNALTVIKLHAAKGERSADGRARQSFAYIAEASERAAGVARQLLAFARRQPTQSRPVDLGALIEEMRPHLERLATERITVRYEIAADRWPGIADPTQIERVLVNLVANARDAMPDGGEITLAVGNQPGQGGGADHVCVRVRDTGCGMSEEVRAHLFEPFFTTKADRGGTGLGLASAYGAMQQMGGAIRIDSQPGRGTQVTLLCRRASAAPPESRRARTAPPDAAAARLTVLCVEDVPQLREAVAASLRETGYRVLTAADGEQAIQIAAGHPAAIDVLVTDVVLPRHDGYAIARRLRERYPALRVLYMSGYDRPRGLERALAEPGTAFLSKPFSSDELLAQLDVLVRR